MRGLFAAGKAARTSQAPMQRAGVRDRFSQSGGPELLYRDNGMDTESVVRAARETGAILTLEDHSILGGLGGAVAETVVEHCPVPMQRVGIRDCFGQSGDPERLYRDNGMDTESVVRAAHALLARKNA